MSVKHLFAGLEITFMRYCAMLHLRIVVSYIHIDCFDCLLRPKHNFPGHSSINGEQRSLCVRVSCGQ